MYILGINAYHGDSSACLICDGRIVAAAEEERFRRVKHWAGFPSRAIGYCLAEAAIEPAWIDHVAVNSDPNANLLSRVVHVLASQPDPRLLLDRLRNRRRRSSVAAELKRLPGAAFRGSVHGVEHHLAHLASCFLVSPFEQAAVVSIDGFGDFSSGAWGVGQGCNIQIQGRVFFPHSLGVFYQALTQYLGFPHYGDEYKVMGLAPYGRLAFLDAMRDIVRLHADGSYELNLRYFRHHREYVPYKWGDGSPHVGDLFSPALEELLGPRRQPNDPLQDRHRDLARSTQAIYEEAFFNLLNALQARTGLTDLTVAGGCAMNSVANGKVRRMTPFRRLYAQSAAGDAGGAIGAAIAVWQELGGPRSFVMDHAYWGPQFDAKAINVLIADHKSKIAMADCTVKTIADVSELCLLTASAIADGKIIGWFQGRMEWGPRALGNRSILGDPRRPDMKDILNLKIKRRESFRPFAPSVLEDHVAEWFEEDDQVPFMMQVFQIRPEKRQFIPAVTHVDGSGRLQTVSARTNPLYYRLIDTFRGLTSVPMLLNTSFNENEPVVCEPREALDCFLRTKMDMLVMGSSVLLRMNTT
jgi:carbamoyltransferase